MSEKSTVMLCIMKLSVHVGFFFLLQLSQLQEFYLYGNKLVTLPPEIGALTNLTKLGLSENSLTTLPDTLQNLKNLRVLDLRHNRLNEVSECLFQ